MELSDTKSQDRFSMTDTVNSEDLNERIQEIIRQHYGQKDSSSSARKRSFPLLRSSSKKRSITPNKIVSAEFDDKNNNATNNRQTMNKKPAMINTICQSPNDFKYQRSAGKQNNDELSSRNGNQQQGCYSPNNNSLLKYSPSTQAPIIERSDFKEGDYHNNHNHYLLENGFSSRKQPYFEASAIHEDQNESDQTIIYPSNSQKKVRSINHMQHYNQNSPAFSKSINSEAGFYKTFNEEDSQTDIKNLINKLDKKNHTLNNLTQNTSCSFLNGGSATKINNQNQNKYQKQDQQIVSQFSQQYLSEILPNHLVQNYQQQSNLPYLLKQQQEYESNENVNRMSAQTLCIQNIENALSTLQECIKKLTIKQLNAIKMMVKPLDCVQQITICIASLVKDGRRIMESFDINKSTQKTEPDEAMEELPWKSLQEYFTSPGRLMNELSRIADIIEMNQVSERSIDYCKDTVESLQDLQIPDNPLLQEQMVSLLAYIQAVYIYHDYKMQLKQLEQEEYELQKRISFEKKMMKQQQIIQKENICYEQRNFKKDINISNFSSKSSRDKNQNGVPLSRKQSHDRQSNMTFGQSICSDSNKNNRNVLQPPKQSATSQANSQTNLNNNININMNNNSQMNSSQQLSTSIVVKTPIKNQKKDTATPSKKQSMQKKLGSSSSHKDILINSNNKINKSSRNEKSERSLSKSSSHKLHKFERETKGTDMLSESSRSGINLPKQMDITNTKTMNRQSSNVRQNTQTSNISTRSSNRLNTSCSSISSHTQLQKNNCPLSQTLTTSNKNKSNLDRKPSNSTEKRQQLSSSKLHKKESQSSLMQQSTQSTRSRFSTQLSDENRQFNNTTNQFNNTNNSRSNSNRKQDSIFSMQNKRNNLKNNNIQNSPSSNQDKTNSCFGHTNSQQSTSNRQRSLSQSSRNSSSTKDLKSRNEAAANSKVSRLDKILNLKVRKPDANSCVKNIINNYEEFNQRNNSIESRQPRNASQVSKQKLQIQKQINQEKQEILSMKQKKSKLESFIERDSKQRIQEQENLDDKIHHEWKQQERDRLHDFLDDQKRREKQLIKEMNEESIKCQKTVKQIQDWEDHQYQNHHHQQNYINHLYNESQKEREKRDESDMLHYKKQNTIDDKHQKSMNSQKSVLESSMSYQEEDLKRLNNELKGQQKRKKDLEDTLERTLDVIYNYRKISCYKQL